jgi:hypothetical protein
MGSDLAYNANSLSLGGFPQRFIRRPHNFNNCFISFLSSVGFLVVSFVLIIAFLTPSASTKENLSPRMVQ